MTTNQANLAYSRMTSQTGQRLEATVNDWGSSMKAVDGNPNPNFGGGSCTHTDSVMNPWWRVWVGGNGRKQNLPIHYVMITNRILAFGRLNNFAVYVVQAGIPDRHLCYHFQGKFPPDTRLLKCKDDTPEGSLVEIKLLSDKKEILTLCEVAVFDAYPGWYTPGTQVVESKVDVTYSGTLCQPRGPDTKYCIMVVKGQPLDVPHCATYTKLERCTIPPKIDDFEYTLAWNEWSPCSTTCGEGVRQREEMCHEPQFQGHPCPIDYHPEKETSPCSSSPCPVISTTVQTTRLAHESDTRFAKGTQNAFYGNEKSTRFLVTASGGLTVDVKGDSSSVVNEREHRQPSTRVLSPPVRHSYPTAQPPPAYGDWVAEKAVTKRRDPLVHTSADLDLSNGKLWKSTTFRARPRATPSTRPPKEPVLKNSQVPTDVTNIGNSDYGGNGTVTTVDEIDHTPSVPGFLIAFLSITSLALLIGLISCVYYYVNKNRFQKTPKLQVQVQDSDVLLEHSSDGDKRGSHWHNGTRLSYQEADLPSEEKEDGLTKKKRKKKHKRKNKESQQEYDSFMEGGELYDGQEEFPLLDIGDEINPEEDFQNGDILGEEPVESEIFQPDTAFTEPEGTYAENQNARSTRSYSRERLQMSVTRIPVRPHKWGTGRNDIHRRLERVNNTTKSDKL